MNNTFIQNAILYTLLLCAISMPVLAQDNAPKRIVYFNVHHSALLLLKPNEVGFGLNRMMQSGKWGLAFNYRYAFSNAKAPNDFINNSAGFISLGKDIIALDKLSTFLVRAVRRVPLNANYEWKVEAGVSYIYSIMPEFIPRPFFTNRNYDVKTNKYHLIGLNLHNRISITKGKNTSLDFFVHNNINTRFSYTTVGFQWNLGRIKN